MKPPLRCLRFLALAVVAPVVLSGCASPQPSSVAGTPDRSAPAVEPMTARSSVCGFSREDEPIEYQRWGHGPTRVMVIASIHGNEPAGTPLVNAMLNHVAHHACDLASDVSIIVVPVANPDGYAAGTRGNAAGVDLNRDFPARNSRRGTPLSQAQPETRALVDLIDRYEPERIVSIHQPVACVDYDGPARDLAQDMAAACDLPLRKLGARPGSLGSWAGVDRNIPIITLELPRGAERHSGEVLWERYGEAMMVFVRTR